jgi:hypothetical protein
MIEAQVALGRRAQAIRSPPVYRQEGRWMFEPVANAAHARSAARKHSAFGSAHLRAFATSRASETNAVWAAEALRRPG